MSTNFYLQSGIPGGRTSEQRLIENLITEAIKAYGFDIFYLPRTEVFRDTIFEDDVLAKFENAIPLEMYLENVDGYGGDGDLMQKFGIELRDTATFVVVRSRWEDVVGYGRSSVLPLPNRPSEGDILYMPLTESYFEIKHVDALNPFFQLGKLHVYNLRCEIWQYSSERVTTGVPEVDIVDSDHNMDTGNYGISLEDGSALLLNDAAFNVADTGQLMYEGFTIQGHDPIADNEQFNTLALDVLDFTEINPFGELVNR
jgi:hypothetical protein